MKDSPEGNKFELHSTALTGPTAALLPITLVAHKEEVKSRWLSEIRSFATDQVALQEHATDDLRIDPNHVQQVDVQVLKLPQRIDSVDPDQLIRPSDFAKDHFLTKNQRKLDDKDEVTETVTVTNSSVVDTGFTERKLLQRGFAVSDREEVTVEKTTSTAAALEESPSKFQKVGEKVSRIPVKTPEKAKEESTAIETTDAEKTKVAEETRKRVEEEEKKKRTEEDQAKQRQLKEEDEKRKTEERRKQKEDEDNERRRKEDLRILEEKRKEEEEFAKRQEELTRQQELRKLKEVEEERERRSQEEAERKVQLKNEENLRKIQEAGAIDIRVVETVKTEKAVVVEVATTTTAATSSTVITAAGGDNKPTTPIKTDQASDGKQSTSSAGPQKASGSAKAVPLRKIASKPIEDPDPPDRKPPHRNSDGSHPPTVIPDFNPPPALVYHTTFEVQLHKEPLPPPPVPPKITHKVVVHNESLEQRTEEFLRGDHCEFDAINYSLQSAQSKIKNIKCMVGKSNQETDMAEDTVQKAKSGEFHKIIHPPVALSSMLPKPKPYEVVEIVTQPGDSDKLPEEMQKKYNITKELLMTKREQKISSSSSSFYHHEGNSGGTNFLLYTQSL